MDPLIIVGRFKQAFEHSTEEARKLYLKQHPKADPKNHTVKHHDDGHAEPEEHDEKGEKKPEHEESGGAKGGLFKRLSDKAKTFLGHSSAAVQKLVSDPDHRKKVMQSATQTIKDSPKTYAKRILATAKEEVHEFKEAGEALKHIFAGKELNHHQKKALKTVAIHMSIAIAAAALTSTGVLAGAAALGKGMAQKVAMKAALKSLEHVHMLNEVSHIGHGLHHLIAAEGEEGGQLNPEEAFAALVMQMTLKELENLDEDTLSEALESAAGEQEKQAWKVGAAAPADLVPTLAKARAALIDLKDWIKRFDGLLLVARSESESLPADRVWQDRFVRYFEQADPMTSQLEALDEVLDDIWLDSENLGDIANQARQLIKMPRHAQVTYAIADIDFSDNPNTGRQGISYSVPRLKEWAGELSKWATDVPGKLLDLSRKATRIRP